ncbi:MAG TPA: hypothetical protein VN026_00805 [Bacteroidia bacterium]|jgi:hypothetical protein|nr:hypothetical protein [Bacteroidia bacterium]
MEKYLVLEFKNAGFFRNKMTKDFVFDIRGRTPRFESEFYDEPINANHVSNVLHVLFGERPVPSLRKVVFERVDYYYEKALDSFICIDAYKQFHKKKEKDEYISETMSVKKAVHNSWSKLDFVYWERVRKLLGDELFTEMTALLTKLIKEKDIREKYSFKEIKSIVRERQLLDNPLLIDFFAKLKQNGKTSLVMYFVDDKRAAEMNMNSHTALTVNNGVEKVTRLNGEIVIPVNDEDILKLSNSKGCATILDGGLVFIKGIFTANRINVSKHTKVNEIGLETSKNKEKNAD